MESHFFHGLNFSTLILVAASKTSGFFGLTRGVRQGCPLSPYLFKFCSEILATAIRHDRQIKAIKILRTESKISQYADDTTLILDGTEKSLKTALTLLALFASIFGLRINYEKTEILCIGTLNYNQNYYFIEQNLKWAKQKVQALGVWFSTKDNESVALNYYERKARLNAVSNTWQFRKLTLLGKITVVKSLAASLLVYIVSASIVRKRPKRNKPISFQFHLGWSER